MKRGLGVNGSSMNSKRLSQVRSRSLLPNQTKGQVTVFIIAAILIVGLAMVVYFLRPGITSTTEFDEKNPTGFIQTCMEEEITNAVSLVSLQGGSTNPEHFILSESNKIEYLCYMTEDCRPCVVQRALLKQHIESEIKEEIESSVASCFEKLVASYESGGYTTNLEHGPNATKVELLPKRVVTSFNYTLTATKANTKRYDSFNVVLNNNLYELVSIANSIIDSESNLGDADPGFYMSLYPDLKVEKFNQNDGSTIYIVTDRNREGNSFQFASRSVALPAGYACNNVATN